jgi:hypothetical protein
MLTQLGGGAVISLLNFGIHAVITGLIVVVTRHMGSVIGEKGMFARVAALLIMTMVALMCAHVVEITVWSAYYHLIGLEVENATSFEFAFENYTALGYGDATPAERWRLTGPITALNGLLLVGWSVAVIFEVIAMAEVKFPRLPRRKRRRSQPD